MPAFPDNPSVRAVEDRDHLGDIWETARAAGVKPDTIRTWMKRRKVSPILRNPGQPDLFHIPTVLEAAAVGAKHRPKAEAA